MTIVAKTKRYLPVVKGVKNYIVPEKELKLPYGRREAQMVGIDEGSVTVVMFFPRIGAMATAKEEDRLL